jgi:hypothetical protein
MNYVEFSRQFLAVQSAIQTSLEQFPLKTEAGVPEDWNATIARARVVAESLMLCPDVERAVAELRQDQTIMLIVIWMLTEIDDQTLLLILQRAYEATPLPSSNLPGQAFASVLIEICDNWQPPPKRA